MVHLSLSTAQAFSEISPELIQIVAKVGNFLKILPLSI